MALAMLVSDFFLPTGGSLSLLLCSLSSMNSFRLHFNVLQMRVASDLHATIYGKF